MKVTLGILDETGCEGAYWTAQEEGKEGYDGLHLIREGMYLRIPGVWQGTVKFSDDINRVWYEWMPAYVKNNNFRGALHKAGFTNTSKLNRQDCKDACIKNFSGQMVNNYWCHKLPLGIDPLAWAKWFESESTAYLYDSYQDFVATQLVEETEKLGLYED